MLFVPTSVLSTLHLNIQCYLFSFLVSCMVLCQTNARRWNCKFFIASECVWRELGRIAPILAELSSFLALEQQSWRGTGQYKKPHLMKKSVFWILLGPASWLTLSCPSLTVISCHHLPAPWGYSNLVPTPHFTSHLLISLTENCWQGTCRHIQDTKTIFWLIKIFSSSVLRSKLWGPCWLVLFGDISLLSHLLMLIGTVRTPVPAVFLHITWVLRGSLRLRGRRELHVILPPLREAWEASRRAPCSRPQESSEVHLSWRPAVTKPWWQPAWGSAPAVSALGPICASQLAELPPLLRSRKACFTMFLLISYFTVSAYLTALWKNCWISRWFFCLILEFLDGFLLWNSLSVMYGIIMQCTACQNIVLRFFFSEALQFLLRTGLPISLIMLILIVNSYSQFKSWIQFIWKGVLQKLNHRGKQNTVFTTAFTTGCFLKIICASVEAKEEHLLSYL